MGRVWARAAWVGRAVARPCTPVAARVGVRQCTRLPPPTRPFYLDHCPGVGKQHLPVAGCTKDCRPSSLSRGARPATPVCCFDCLHSLRLPPHDKCVLRAPCCDPASRLRSAIARLPQGLRAVRAVVATALNTGTTRHTEGSCVTLRAGLAHDQPASSPMPKRRTPPSRAERARAELVCRSGGTC